MRKKIKEPEVKDLLKTRRKMAPRAYVESLKPAIAEMWEDGLLTYKQEAEWLSQHDYKTPDGKEFTENRLKDLSGRMWLSDFV